MNLEELRALDVPAVFVELVIEDVRVRKVRLERFDDLFGFLFVESECVLVDGACFLSYGLLGTHDGSYLTPDSRINLKNFV